MILGETNDGAISFFVKGVEINPSELKLRDGKSDTQVELKMMTLLIILAAKSSVLVSREYMMNGIWQDHRGSDQSLTRLVYQLRRSFKLFSSLTGTIKTVSRSGYRLDASLSMKPNQELSPGCSIAESPTRRREYDLSIGVMPFTDHDTTPENRYLVDGMCRDLTSLLATTAMLHVTPHSSAVALYSKELPIETVAETIGCPFMLTGSFRRLGTQIRLRFELVDVHEASLAWTGLYDTVLDRFLEAQRDVLQTVSTAISTRVRFPVIVPKTSARAFQSEVYRVIQSAETLRYSYSYSYGKPAAQAINRLLEQGLALDPGNVVLQSGLAVQLTRMMSTSGRRIPRVPRNGPGASSRATAHLFMLDYASAMTACEQAIARTPNYYQPRLSLAWALAGVGDQEAATRAIKEAEKFEGQSITSKFIDEMNKWVRNSPNAAHCVKALDDLRPLAAR